MILTKEHGMPGRSTPPFIFASGADKQEKQLITRRVIIGSTIGIIVSGGTIGGALHSQSLDANNQTSTQQSSPYSYYGHKHTVLSATWSPNDKHVASASSDGTVQVWNTRTGNALLTYRGHHGSVYSAVWSPDGRFIASAGTDNTVQVWDSKTGSVLLTYRGHQYWVNSAAWSPDGRFIASTSSDKTVQVWDSKTGNALLTYRGHHGSVYSAVWSPEG